MSEATLENDAPALEATEPAAAGADAEAERAVDRDRMKRIGQLHFVVVMAAITLWGAADAWAQSSGLGLATIVAVVNAYLAATIVSSIAHEWTHFAGARLSGATAPVLEKPVNYFFMFDFKFDQNDQRQFAWMSWGGILAPWVLALAVFAFVPLDTLSRMVLLATVVARAASASFFEVPVVMKTQGGSDPRAELGRALPGLKRSGQLGSAVGVATLAVLWLAA